MRSMERVPTVRRIETNRDNIFAVEIVGKFTSADAENLCGLLEGACALHEQLDLLVRLADAENVDLHGLDPNTAKIMQALVESHVTHCAIIGKNAMTAWIERLFSSGSTTKTRHFRHESETEAWHWLNAQEIRQDD